MIATKAVAPKSHKLRVVVLKNEALAGQALSVNPEAQTPEREALLAEMVRRVEGRQGRKDGIHVHDVKQTQLVADRPWPVKHGAKDVGSRVVAHLQGQLDQVGSVEELAERWSIPQGVQTGADSYTPRIRTRLRNSFPEALK